MNGNIEELINTLKQLGIDTTNMSEEDIRKLASIIDKIIKEDSTLSREELQRKLANTLKENPEKLKAVPSPSNLSIKQPSTSSRPHNNLDNKDQKPNQGNMGSPSKPPVQNPDNKGMNYTDDNNNPRDGRKNSNGANKGNNQVNTNAGSNYGAGGVGVLGENGNGIGVKEGLTSGESPSSSSPQTTNYLQNGSNFSNLNRGSNNNLMGGPLADNQVNELKSGVPSPRNRIIESVNVKGPDIDENGNFKKTFYIAGENPAGDTPAKFEEENKSNANNDSVKKEANSRKYNDKNNNNNLNDNNNNNQNSKYKKSNNNKAPDTTNISNQNKQSESGKVKDAVADNKMDRARRRLKQNGVNTDDSAANRSHISPAQAALAANSMAGGESSENSNTSSSSNSSKSSGFKNLPPSPSLLSRLRSRLSGSARRNRDVEDTYNDPENLVGGIKDQVKKKIKNKIRLWIIANLPTILAVGGVILFFVFSILLIVVIITSVLPGELGLKDIDANSNIAANVSPTANRCVYNTNGNSGQTEVSNAKVELINCDGKASNYKTLDTIDFEKYVLGVALAEIGPDSPDEAIKAQIVAARTFALSRNKGMCPSDPDNCFYGYNKSTNTIRMRACEADQVYWDYTKNIYRIDRGAISLYSPEVNSGIIWKNALSESRIQQVEALANTVKGEVLLDSNGNTIQAGYKSSDQVSMLKEAKNGKNYKEILQKKYGTSPSANGVCQAGTIDYGNYQLSTDNASILHQPLSSFLQSQGTSLEAFNQLISNNVQKAGYGTRAGVVAAAVTLIAELSNKYNVRVPYFWGGGHEQTYTLASGNWGSSSCHTYANGQDYNYCGLDCSGFVGWAIYNGGFRDVTTLADSYVNVSGARHVNLSNSAVLQPGDLLYSSAHVILIIGVDNDNAQYICAEAAGNASGVIFSRHSFTTSKYSGVDLTGFYDNNKRG